MDRAVLLAALLGCHPYAGAGGNRPPGDGTYASCYPGRCPGLREGGPSGPQANTYRQLDARAGATRSKPLRTSGPKARVPSAQPNGLGCDRSPSSSKPHRGVIASALTRGFQTASLLPRVCAAHPIRQAEPGDAREFPEIVGHEGRPQAAGVSSNLQVVGADRAACRRELGPDSTGFARRGFGPVQELDIFQEGPNDPAQRVATIAPLDPILELEKSDDGDLEVARSERPHPLDQRRLRALHEVTTDIGVEDVHQDSERSWGGGSSPTSKSGGNTSDGSAKNRSQPPEGKGRRIKASPCRSIVTVSVSRLSSTGIRTAWFRPLRKILAITGAIEPSQA